ncbi:alpha/beta hydrolase [Leucobacter allii]|uniref:Alpha/beta hydrolase n=1 Tax=Leucobacter allii TaxID=2932247 RepID=A0ABY4FL62_9MICO|nr:alpha/beta fold hydrolase [Leucobacter allii]UOQ57004.1 alpha/beta hydrolase [Leucobacter allii]
MPRRRRLQEFVGGGIRAAARVSPALGGALAYRAFFATSPRMPVREAEAALFHEARRASLRVRGRAIAVFEWGEGAPAVLLMHGWRGRATQFAPLVRELLAQGCRVVAFDAPGHGASPGRRADIRDWVDAAERLQASHGPFGVVVGHSFGALAALACARSAVPVPAVVSIAGATSPVAFVERFAHGLGLAGGVAEEMLVRLRRRLAVDEDEFARRYDAVRHPLPASTELLVAHDRGDRTMPCGEAVRLRGAHAGRSRLLLTEGCGHNRILASDRVLAAVGALARGDLRSVDALAAEDEGATAATTNQASASQPEFPRAPSAPLMPPPNAAGSPAS